MWVLEASALGSRLLQSEALVSFDGNFTAAESVKDSLRKQVLVNLGTYQNSDTSPLDCSCLRVA